MKIPIVRTRKRDIDTLKFTDVNYAEVKFRRVDNDLMLFGYHDTDSVTVKSFYSHVVLSI